MFKKIDQIEWDRNDSRDAEKIRRLLNKCYEDGTFENVAREIEKRMRATSDSFCDE